MAPAVLERIAERRVATHPLAQLHEARFIGGEINKVVAGQNRQYIKIIGQAPIHAIGSDICRQIRWIYQKHYTRYILETVEKLTVVAQKLSPVRRDSSGMRDIRPCEHCCKASPYAFHQW